MADRNVRRRLNPDSSLVAVFNDARIDLRQLDICELSSLCFKVMQEFENVLQEEQVPLQSNDDNAETNELDLFDDILELLGSWVAGGMIPFPGVSAKRAERWSSYNVYEKWIFYAVHLMNKVMVWSDEGSSFLNAQSRGVLCSDSYAHVTYILSLTKRWNESNFNSTQLQVKLVAYASLEHVWFGYV